MERTLYIYIYIYIYIYREREREREIRLFNEGMATGLVEENLWIQTRKTSLKQTLSHILIVQISWYIIIIMSRNQHGYPWPFLATPLYRPLLLAGLQGYIPNCYMYVQVGRSAFARPCEGVHRSTSLMSSFPLLLQCSACLVRLNWIVFVMGGRWPYSSCFVGCCLQDLFNIACSILV